MRVRQVDLRPFLLLLGLGLPACSEPDQPAEITVTPGVLSFDALTDAKQLNARVRNEKGIDLTGAAVTWESSNPAVATVDASGLVTSVSNGTAVVSAGAGAIGRDINVTVAQAVANVEATSGASQTGTVTQALSAALVARVRDRLNQGIKDITVNFTVSAGGGTVSPTNAVTGTDGTASTTWTFATAAGTHMVTATPSGSAVTAAFTGTANPGPAFVLSKSSGDNQSGYRGTRLTQLLGARVRDQFGNAIKNHPVTFTTSEGTADSTTAFTDSAGVARTGWVLPDAIDTVALAASATQSLGGPALTGSPQAFSAIAHGLRVTSVSPGPLVEGQAAVLMGNGFDPTPGNNTVMVGDLAATVNTASPTQLDITVPAGDCRPARSANVTVATGGFTSTPVAATVNPTAFVNLAVGQQTILRDPTQFCFQFPKTAAEEAYLIGVQSTSETVTDLTGISLAGTSVAPAASRAFATRQNVAPATWPVNPARLERWRRHRAVELAIREDDRRAWESLSARRAPGAAPAMPPIVSGDVNLGDTVAVRVTTGGGCGNFIDATTVVRAKGQRGIFLQHITAPAGGLDNTHFTTFMQGFDTHYFVNDSAYFGNPGDRDANGRVVVVFTPEVNKRGALGFTTSCDNAARADAPASNEGEFFYVRVPDPNGQFDDAYALADALDDVPPTLSHELVHVIQFAGRQTAGGPILSIWLAEGQAVMGEEIVGHAVESRTTGQDYGLAIAINLDDENSIDWYSTGIVGLGLYYGWDPITGGNADGRTAEAPHECSWLASKPTNPGPCVGGLDPYGAPWALLRWLADRFYPGSNSAQSTFQRNIINSTQNGYAVVQSQIGVSMDTLLAQFAAMLYLDGRVSSAAPELTMSSWNLYNIFYEVANGIRLRTALRLQPAGLTYSTFSRTANVRAGSTHYSVISGFNREATAVKARNSAGAPLPPWMRYWIVRLQ
ncbi:MAG TPA: Ig-like domain-containing protein [Gemmatimonadales bacterium]|nr:Ig-like domain-containing protein [Gemmatimonadales bacterium]